MRLHNILGLIAAVMLLLSAPAHSLLGWPQLRDQLAQANAPEDLVNGLMIGWHFAGAAMVAFGIIVLRTSLPWRVRPTLSPLAVVAALYLVFGAWALVVSRFDPFFAVFIVPGSILLLAVVTGLRTSAPR